MLIFMLLFLINITFREMKNERAKLIKVLGVHNIIGFLASKDLSGCAVGTILSAICFNNNF